MKTFANRVRAAARMLLQGEDLRGIRTPIRALTPDEVAEAREFFPMEKFFLFGHARSGTTLLMRLVDVHPEVHCARQGHFFTRPPFLEGLVNDPAIADWLGRGSFRWNRGEDLSPVVLRAAADFILERDARRHGARIVGDKSPNSLNDGAAVVLAQKVYPDARILFIVRDGRDAVLSHRFQAFIDATQHLTPEDMRIRSEFTRDPDAFRDPDRSLFTTRSIQDYARGWVRNLETTAAEGQNRYPDRFFKLRFEDLLAEPLVQMKAVWEFLGAENGFEGMEEAVRDTIGLNRDQRWQEEQAGELMDAIPKGQTGGWQTFFTQRDRELFWQIAGATLEKWGYAL